LLLLGSRGPSADMDSGSSAGAARSRPAPARTAAATRAPAGGTPAEGGGEDFEDFPGALEEEDDDLPF
jgi:single-strand DNA-binding protein